VKFGAYRERFPARISSAGNGTLRAAAAASWSSTPLHAERSSICFHARRRANHASILTGTARRSWTRSARNWFFLAGVADILREGRKVLMTSSTQRGAHDVDLERPTVLLHLNMRAH
jgi:hypothetical protein